MIAPETYKRTPAVQLLPSANSALALARGEPGALWAVLGHTLARALVMAPAGIAAGAVMGVSPKASVAIVLGAAVGIEIGIIALAMKQAKAFPDGSLQIQPKWTRNEQSTPEETTPLEQAKADKAAKAAKAAAKELPAWMRGEKTDSAAPGFAWA